MAKKIFKAGFYWVEDTMINGLYRVKGPGVAGFAGDVRQLPLLKEVALLLDFAYTAGRMTLAGHSGRQGKHNDER